MNIKIEILLTSLDQFFSGHMDFLNGSEGILMVIQRSIQSSNSLWNAMYLDSITTWNTQR